MDLRDEKKVLDTCNRIRQTAFDLHTFLKHGHFEKVYENGLAHRLRKNGHFVEQQKSIQIRDVDGTILGEYIADMFVDGCIIVEVKACRTLIDEHLGQVFGYLRGSGYHDAVLVNFGNPKIQIRKIVL